MKKLICVLLSSVIIFSAFTACGPDNNNDLTPNPSTSQKDNSKLRGEKVLVPDLNGCDEESAKMLLINAGLVPVFNECYDDEVAYGMVASTEPAGLTEVIKGTSVTVYISLGSSNAYAATWSASYIPPFNAKGYNEGIFFEVQNVRRIADELLFDASFVFSGHEYSVDTTTGEFYGRNDFIFPQNITVRIGTQVAQATVSGECVEDYHCNINIADGKYYPYTMSVSVPLDNIENKFPSQLELDVPFTQKQIYTDTLNFHGVLQENIYNFSTTIYVTDIVW